MILQNNPFEILTFIVAPAMLTNASSILSLSTSNRFARTVDRSRYIYEKMKTPEKMEPQEIHIYQKQLPVIGRRSLLLVRALTCFYFSVGAFTATALVCIIGAGVMYIDNALASKITILGSLICGVAGVIGLVSGTAILVAEMWLALHFMQTEIELSEGIQINPIL